MISGVPADPVDEIRGVDLHNFRFDNNMYNYIERLPTVSEYNSLRETAGWGAIDESVVANALPNSIYSITATYKDQTIAFARMIGDGYLVFYIQEIIVHPDHQKKGIASQFMALIFNFLNSNANTSSYIGVFAGKNLEEFYERYGFWKRPTNTMGHGMMQFWKDIELNNYFQDTNNKQ